MIKDLNLGDFVELDGQLIKITEIQTVLHGDNENYHCAAGVVMDGLEGKTIVFFDDDNDFKEVKSND